MRAAARAECGGEDGAPSLPFFGRVCESENFHFFESTRKTNSSKKAGRNDAPRRSSFGRCRKRAEEEGRTELLVEADELRREEKGTCIEAEKEGREATHEVDKVN